jgi:hypothetical protein
VLQEPPEQPLHPVLPAIERLPLAALKSEMRRLTFSLWHLTQFRSVSAFFILRIISNLV